MEESEIYCAVGPSERKKTKQTLVQLAKLEKQLVSLLRAVEQFNKACPWAKLPPEASAHLRRVQNYLKKLFCKLHC